MAALPNESLLEDRPKAPAVIGPTGWRPMEAICAPLVRPRGRGSPSSSAASASARRGRSAPPRTAGGSDACLRRGPETACSAGCRRRGVTGHEILLQVPMEPFDYPNNDPGPHALRVSSDAGKNLAALHRSMGQITNYTGRDELSRRPVSLRFGCVSSPSCAISASGASCSWTTDVGAIALGPLAAPSTAARFRRSRCSMASSSRNAILRRLDSWSSIARRNGTRDRVASAFDESRGGHFRMDREAEAGASRWSAWPHSSKIRNKTDLSAVDHRVIRLAATCKEGRYGEG